MEYVKKFYCAVESDCVFGFLGKDRGSKPLLQEFRGKIGVPNPSYKSFVVKSGVPNPSYKSFLLKKIRF